MSKAYFKEQAEKIEQLIFITRITNMILKIVFDEHPDIVLTAITNVIEELEENAQVQKEDNSTHGL
jgi:hypothetical protein